MALITPTLTVCAEAERIADRHHPVAGLHLRRVAELHLGEVALRLDQLDQGAVGQRIAADDLGFVVDVGFLAEERDLDLGGALDDVVVGEDVAVLADHEAGAGRLRFLLARRRCGCCCCRPPWPPKKRSSKSSSAAAATEELGHLLRALASRCCGC